MEVLNWHGNSISDQVKGEKNVPSFTVYIDKKLAKFEKKTKMYIEKT